MTSFVLHSPSKRMHAGSGPGDVFDALSRYHTDSTGFTDFTRYQFRRPCSWGLIDMAVLWRAICYHRYSQQFECSSQLRVAPECASVSVKHPKKDLAYQGGISARSSSQQDVTISIGLVLHQSDHQAVDSSSMSPSSAAQPQQYTLTILSSAACERNPTGMWSYIHHAAGALPSVNLVQRTTAST